MFYRVDMSFKPKNEDPSRTLFIDNLDTKVSEELILTLFGQNGSIKVCKLISEDGYDPCCFVEFFNGPNAVIALQEMNKKNCFGKDMNVKWAASPIIDTSPIAKPLVYFEVYNQSTLNNSTVFCAGVVNGLCESLVQKTFRLFGIIREIKVFADKGFAFIKFESKGDAVQAIVATHRTEINGQTVMCSWNTEAVEINQKRHQFLSLPGPSEAGDDNNFSSLHSTDSSSPKTVFGSITPGTNSILSSCGPSTSNFPPQSQSNVRNTSFFKNVTFHHKAPVFYDEHETSNCDSILYIQTSSDEQHGSSDKKNYGLSRNQTSCLPYPIKVPCHLPVPFCPSITIQLPDIPQRFMRPIKFSEMLHSPPSRFELSSHFPVPSRLERMPKVPLEIMNAEESRTTSGNNNFSIDHVMSNSSPKFFHPTFNLNSNQPGYKWSDESLTRKIDLPIYTAQQSHCLSAPSVSHLHNTRSDGGGPCHNRQYGNRTHGYGPYSIGPHLNRAHGTGLNSSEGCNSEPRNSRQHSNESHGIGINGSEQYSNRPQSNAQNLGTHSRDQLGSEPNSSERYNSGPHDIEQTSGMRSSDRLSCGPHSIEPYNSGLHSAKRVSSGLHSTERISSGVHTDESLTRKIDLPIYTAQQSHCLSAPSVSHLHNTRSAGGGPCHNRQYGNRTHGYGPYSIGPHLNRAHGTGLNSSEGCNSEPRNSRQHSIESHGIGINGSEQYSNGPQSNAQNLGTHSRDQLGSEPNSSERYNSGPHDIEQTSGMRSSDRLSCGPHSIDPYNSGLHSTERVSSGLHSTERISSGVHSNSEQFGREIFSSGPHCSSERFGRQYDTELDYYYRPREHGKTLNLQQQQSDSISSSSLWNRKYCRSLPVLSPPWMSILPSYLKNQTGSSAASDNNRFSWTLNSSSEFSDMDDVVSSDESSVGLPEDFFTPPCPSPLVRPLHTSENMLEAQPSSAPPPPVDENIPVQSDLIKEASVIFPMPLVERVVQLHMKKFNCGFATLNALCEEVLEYEEKEEAIRKRASEDKSKAGASTSAAENPKDVKEILLCKICMELEVGVVFQPCGHLLCCPNCAEKLLRCPMCRACIKNTVRTYLS